MNTTKPRTGTTDVVLVTSDEQAGRLLRQMDEEFVELTGGSAYLYPFAPTDGAWRFTFADQVVPNRARALEHMDELLTAARTMDRSRLWWLDL